MKHLFAYLLYIAVPVIILLNSSCCFSQSFICNYGGPGYSEGHALAQCSDGGFILTGLSECFGNDSGNIYLIKTDMNGVMQWQQIHGCDSLDGGNSVVTCPDGGYFIAGHTECWGAGDCDGFAMKTDSRGDSVWMNTYGNIYDDVAYDGIVSNDGGYVMTGLTIGFGFGEADVYLCKFDENGKRVWVQRYGGSREDVGWSVRQTSDNGYIIAGYTTSFTEDSTCQIYLIKTDEYGNMQWQKTYGDSDSTDYRGYRVRLTPDGGYAVVGYCGNFNTNANSLLLKTDASGNVQWMKQYKSNEAYFLTTGLTTTNDGGYLLSGGTLATSDSSAKALLLKVDQEGNLQWLRKIGSNGLNYNAYNVIQTTDGKYAFIGTAQINNNGVYDFLLMVVDSTGQTASISQIPLNQTSVTAYPNPSSDRVTFQIQYYNGSYSILLYNILGQLVRQVPNQIITTFNMDRNGLPSGLYYYEIENSNSQVINKGKIVLQ
jgi:hypothetical protein